MWEGERGLGRTVELGRELMLETWGRVEGAGTGEKKRGGHWKLVRRDRREGLVLEERYRCVLDPWRETGKLL